MNAALVEEKLLREFVENEAKQLSYFAASGFHDEVVSAEAL